MIIRDLDLFRVAVNPDKTHPILVVNPDGVLTLAFLFERLKLIAIDGGKGCITPSDETIKNGTYAPLSRPLFIYVSQKALARPEVKAFVDFYLSHGAELVPQVGYVALDGPQYQQALGKIGQPTTAQ